MMLKILFSVLICCSRKMKSTSFALEKNRKTFLCRLPTLLLFGFPFPPSFFWVPQKTLLPFWVENIRARNALCLVFFSELRARTYLRFPVLFQAPLLLMGAREAIHQVFLSLWFVFLSISVEKQNAKFVVVRAPSLISKSSERENWFQREIAAQSSSWHFHIVLE